MRIAAFLVALAGVALPRLAAAQAPGSEELAPSGRPAVILPTVVVRGAERASLQDEREAASLAAVIDALLTDAAQDLGLAVDLGHRERRGAPLAERELAGEARAIGGTLIAPTVSVSGAEVELRIVLADAGARSLRVRVERVARADVPVRAVVMLRDLVREGAGASAGAPREAARSEGEPTLATPARSAGKITLAVNSTIFGGFIGYSVLRSSGSEDPRLLYPLLAVGAGVGLGASVIAAEEWDVGVGDAWFLAAAAWWPTVAGHLIWEGRFSDDGPADERWAFGLVGGTAGITIGTLALARAGIAEGGATVAHSGGGLGLIFGGLTELFAEGDIYDELPFAGMGYGAGIGWLAAAAVGTRIHVSPGRVFAIDLGAVLGGLGGAALASPLLFDEPSKARQRGWLGATAGGALLGGGIAWYTTRDTRPASGKAPPGSPFAGVLGESVAALPGGARRAPIYGAGWRGELP